MTDRISEQFYTILTDIGKASIANASALGTKVDFKYMALGDGNGNYYNPTEQQTELVNEVWRGQINNVMVDDDNPNWIKVITVIPVNVGGFTVREAGAFDTDGNLLAVGKYPETYKPHVEDGSAKDLHITLILEVSNAMVVNLKIDPSVVLATRKDIDSAIDRIKIGGRNYLQLSSMMESPGLFKGNQYVTITNPNNEYTRVHIDQDGSTPGIIINPFDIEDATYTISFDVRGFGGLTSINVNLRGNKSPNIDITEEFQRKSVILRPKFTQEYLLIHPIYPTIGEGFDIKNIKIEKGNKATDWTTALEDPLYIKEASSDTDPNTLTQFQAVVRHANCPGVPGRYWWIETRNSSSNNKNKIQIATEYEHPAAAGGAMYTRGKWNTNQWSEWVKVATQSDIDKTIDALKDGILHEMMPLNGGTFTGIAKAHPNVSYTTAQMRNIILSPTDPVLSQMKEGEIWFKYR